MKQATTRKNETPLTWRIKEGTFILLNSLAIYILIALITYHASDPSWSRAGLSVHYHNAAGKTGAWLSDILLSIFGYIAYLFPIGLSLSGFFVYQKQNPSEQDQQWLGMIRALGFLMNICGWCGLVALYVTHPFQDLPMSSGGLLGSVISKKMVANLNPMGTTLMLLSLVLIGMTLFAGFSWIQLSKVAFQRWIDSWKQIKTASQKIPSIIEELPKLLPPKQTKTEENTFQIFTAEPQVQPSEPEISFEPEDDYEPLPVLKRSLVTKKRLKPSKVPSVISKKTIEKAETTHAYSEHFLPSLALLEKSEASHRPGYSAVQLQELSRLVETRLMEFGIEAKVVGVYPGPVITRFELDLAAGIKVNKITSLAKDLARSLSVVSVRVVEVIPGKSVVGLEIPNAQRELVRLKELLEDNLYQQAHSPLTLVLGKDIAGRPVVVDLAKMPHLLVAGTTGSGKSVGLNAMLLSILYKSHPSEIRMILIDPKMLELAVYDHIPHLLTPVVTDMKDAANALRWCVGEMERRYQLMAAVGVRNLDGFNTKVENAEKNGEPIIDPFWHASMGETPEPLTKLPYIVVVVDEFADMIMVVGKKVEELIARIAQKARAAGIHLILATQRPSVDVITGLIKANIPTRIAFQVSSRIDSRTILDQSGAEQLLGHGDMLYLPPGMGVPHRIHGAFVSDDEVHKVANELRKSAKPTYIENVVQSSTNVLSQDQEIDELYDQAVAIVAQERKASISLVQRRLKIGYNRAARLVEQMEMDGIVSAVQPNGTREVLTPSPESLNN